MPVFPVGDHPSRVGETTDKFEGVYEYMYNQARVWSGSTSFNNPFVSRVRAFSMRKDVALNTSRKDCLLCVDREVEIVHRGCGDQKAYRVLCGDRYWRNTET